MVGGGKVMESWRSNGVGCANGVKVAWRTEERRQVQRACARHRRADGETAPQGRLQGDHIVVE